MISCHSNQLCINLCPFHHLIHYKYRGLPLIRTPFLPNNSVLIREVSLVRGRITCIHSTCCQEFVSFLEGCPLNRECPLREGPLYSVLIFPCCLFPICGRRSGRWSRRRDGCRHSSLLWRERDRCWWSKSNGTSWNWKRQRFELGLGSRKGLKSWLWHA